MNILMMTNTYKPILGGLEKSVESFTLEFRKRGHRVIVVAPEFEGMPEREEGVIRMPALQNFNKTEFSMKLPVPGVLSEALGDFVPDIVHSHHPYLMGATALRVAYKYKKPLVFTHHILFEQNTHYWPAGHTDVFKRFVIELSTGYANLADHVFAPSKSLAELLKSRGVEAPIDIVPTGIHEAHFGGGNPGDFRRFLGVPDDAFLVGYIGRLAPEKNLEFLARAVARFLARERSAHFLVAGKGPSADIVRQMFNKSGLKGRLHLVGILTEKNLVDAYHAMDVFAFASQSETQGMALAEAMAAATPVVAVDALAVRDVVRDGVNGRLLSRESEEDFAKALESIYRLPPAGRSAMRAAARASAEDFSMERCVDRALSLYRSLHWKESAVRESEDNAWTRALRLVRAEWDLMKAFTKATKDAVIRKEETTV